MFVISCGLVFSEGYVLSHPDVFDAEFTKANPNLATGDLYTSIDLISIDNNIDLRHTVTLEYSSRLLLSSLTDFNADAKPIEYATPSEYGVGWSYSPPKIEARPKTGSKDLYTYVLSLGPNVKYELVKVNDTVLKEEYGGTVYRTKIYSNLIVIKKRDTSTNESYWIVKDTLGNIYYFNHTRYSLIPTTTKATHNSLLRSGPGGEDIPVCDISTGVPFYPVQYYYSTYPSQWDVSKVVDKFGNSLSFNYEDETTTFRYAYCESGLIMMIRGSIPDWVTTECSNCDDSTGSNFCHKYFNGSSCGLGAGSIVPADHPCRITDELHACKYCWALQHPLDLVPSNSHPEYTCNDITYYTVNYTSLTKLVNISDSYGNALVFEYEELPETYCYHPYNQHTSCVRLDKIKKYAPSGQLIKVIDLRYYNMSIQDMNITLNIDSSTDRYWRVKDVSFLSSIYICSDEDATDCILINKYEYYNKSDDEHLGLLKSITNINGGQQIFEYEPKGNISKEILRFRDLWLSCDRPEDYLYLIFSPSGTFNSFGWRIKSVSHYDPIRNKNITIRYEYSNGTLYYYELPNAWVWSEDHFEEYPGSIKQYGDIYYEKVETITEDNGKTVDYFFTGPQNSSDYLGDQLKGRKYRSEIYSADGELVAYSEQTYNVSYKSFEPTIYSILITDLSSNVKGIENRIKAYYNQYNQLIYTIEGSDAYETKKISYVRYLHEDPSMRTEVIKNNLLSYVSMTAVGTQESDYESFVGGDFDGLETVTKIDYINIGEEGSLVLVPSNVSIYNFDKKRFENQLSIEYYSNGLIRSETSKNITVEYYYNDSTNLLTRKKVPLGFEIYDYDEKLNLIGVKKFNGAVLRYTYDRFGRLNRLYLPGDREPTFIYKYYLYDGETPSHIIIRQQMTGTQAKTLVIYYNGFGQIIQKRTNNQDCEYERCDKVLYINYDYDSAGSLVRISSILSAPESNITFDFPESALYLENVYSKDPLKFLEESYDYDHGLISSINLHGDGGTIIVQETDAMGSTITKEFDSLGRLIRVSDQIGRTLHYEYDGLSKVPKIYTDPLGRKTKTTFDYKDRPIHTNDPDAGYTTTYYDNKDNIIYTSHNNFVINSGFEINDTSYLIEMYPFAGGLEIYYQDCYDGKGCLKLSGPHKIYQLYKLPVSGGENIVFGGYFKKGSRMHSFWMVLKFYDGEDNLISSYYLRPNLTESWSKYERNITVPESAEYAYLYYYSAGYGETYIDDLYIVPNTGSKLSYVDLYYEYDWINRLTSVKNRSGSIVLENIYDRCRNGVGRLCSKHSVNVKQNYNYDKKGRISDYSVTITLDSPEDSESLSVKYTYDHNLLSEEKINGKPIRYMYNNHGELTRVYLSDYKIADFDIDDRGRVTTIEYGNNVESHYQYDNDNFITQITVRTPDTTYFSRRYHYDPLGNIIAISEPVPTSSVDLSARRSEWRPIVSFNYDAVGRLIRVNDITAGYYGNVTYEYDDLDNRIVENGDSVRLRYYFDYQLPSPSNSVRLKYVIVSSGGEMNTINYYQYDNIGRLLSKYTSTYRKHFQGRGPKKNSKEDRFREQHSILESSGFDSIFSPRVRDVFKVYEISYDGLGRVKNINGAFGNETYYYDSNWDRVAKIIEDENNSKIVVYYFRDPAGNIVYERTKKKIESLADIGKRYIDLYPGWNMISYDVYKSLPKDSYICAFGYDPDTNKYFKMDDSRGPNKTDCVFVYMKKSMDVAFDTGKTTSDTGFKLPPGKFVLIGIRNYEQLINLITANSDKQILFWHYEPKLRRYVYVPINEVEPGKGYFIMSIPIVPIHHHTLSSIPSTSPSTVIEQDSLYIEGHDRILARADYNTYFIGQHRFVTHPKIYYYYSDYRTPRFILDRNRKVVWSADYDAFGNPVNLNIDINDTVNNRREFVNHERDDSGLQYFGMRYYDSEIGRFITPDPLPSGLNRYVYAYNNPIGLVDYTGNQPEVLSADMPLYVGEELVVYGEEMYGGMPVGGNYGYANLNDYYYKEYLNLRENLLRDVAEYNKDQIKTFSINNIEILKINLRTSQWSVPFLRVWKWTPSGKIPWNKFVNKLNKEFRGSTAHHHPPSHPVPVGSGADMPHGKIKRSFTMDGGSLKLSLNLEGNLQKWLQKNSPSYVDTGIFATKDLILQKTEYDRYRYTHVSVDKKIGIVYAGIQARFSLHDFWIQTSPTNRIVFGCEFNIFNGGSFGASIGTTLEGDRYVRGWLNIPIPW